MRKGHIWKVLSATLTSLIFTAVAASTGFAEDTTITANPAPQVDVDFNLEPSVLVTIQGGDLIIPHLVPGHSEQSDPVTIVIATNSLNGYTLSAKAGNAEDESANLKHSTATSVFTPLSTPVVGLSNIGKNQWGYSVDGGENFIGLPGYNEEGIILQVTSSMEDPNNEPISFLIGANADADMTAGVYSNVVNFFATVNNPVVVEDTEGDD